MNRVPARAWMLMLVFWAGAQAQTVYRWVDDDGVVHFSQIPPAKRAYSTLGLDTGELNIAPVHEPPRTTASPGRARTGKRRASKTRPGRDEVAQRCAAARQQIDTLNARMRAGYRPAQGERLRERLRRYEKERYRWCVRKGP